MQWKKLRNNYLNDLRKNFAGSLRKPRIPYVRESVEVCGVKDTKEGIQADDSKDAIKSEDSIKPGVIVDLMVPAGVDNIQNLNRL